MDFEIEVVSYSHMEQAAPMWDIASSVFVEWQSWLHRMLQQEKINSYIKNLTSAYCQFQKQETFR